MNHLAVLRLGESFAVEIQASRAQLSNGAAGWQEKKSGQARKQKATAKAASWHHVTEVNGPRERQTRGARSEALEQMVMKARLSGP